MHWFTQSTFLHIKNKLYSKRQHSNEMCSECTEALEELGVGFPMSSPSSFSSFWIRILLKLFTEMYLLQVLTSNSICEMFIHFLYSKSYKSLKDLPPALAINTALALRHTFEMLEVRKVSQPGLLPYSLSFRFVYWLFFFFFFSRFPISLALLVNQDF